MAVAEVDTGTSPFKLRNVIQHETYCSLARTPPIFSQGLGSLEGINNEHTSIN
jgi:hypothetical protein